MALDRLQTGCVDAAPLIAMATIHLVRHGSHAEIGQVLSGRSEIGLSARGLAQAGGLGDRFGRMAIQSIHASPRRRAAETARAIGLACALPVEIEDAFDEIDFGTWSGKAFAELDTDPDWSRWNEERGSARPPEGESMAAVVDRAARRIASIGARETGSAVVVSHCDVIRGVIAHSLGLPLDRLLSFDVDPASVSRLLVESWGCRILSVNECWE